MNKTYFRHLTDASTYLEKYKSTSDYGNGKSHLLLHGHLNNYTYHKYSVEMHSQSEYRHNSSEPLQKQCPEYLYAPHRQVPLNKKFRRLT